MTSANLSRTMVGMPAHPNDLDRKRIERALKARKRYRYVSPSVSRSSAVTASKARAARATSILRVASSTSRF